MLSPNEFIQWCDQLALSGAAIELIKRIRENDPSRRVGGGRKNVTGSYPSKKMGMSIQFESHKVELAGIYIKEYEKTVKEYYDQPPVIKLKYKSLSEKVTALFHTPDYFVIYEDKAGWEEWKSESELQDLAQESPNRYILIDGQWHCPPGEVYARQFGLYYWLKSSRDINWFFQRNIIFLEDYLSDKDRPLSDGSVEMILAFVNNEPGILLMDLISKSKVDSDTIYYMIARNLIYVDLNKEVLSEPENTHVFKDETSSSSLNILFAGKKTPAIHNYSLNIAPGVIVKWDGQPWTILNIGEKNISLSSSNRIANIEKGQFYNMISEHQVEVAESELDEEIDSIITSKLAGASQKALNDANYRYDIILPYLNGKSSNDTIGLDVTDRTLRNWISDYRKAEILYGSGFIGLIPNAGKRGNRSSHLPEETLSIVNVFLDDNENATNQSITLLYGKLANLCEEKGIVCPSKNSFSKIIKSRPKYNRIKKTLGSRAAYQHATFYWELDMTTPRHGERPFEICHIDHTELDIQLIDSKTKKPIGKSWLTLMMDAFSRRVLAFYLTFDAPSYRSDMMVIRECVKRYNRLPQIIITDCGRDFRSIYYESLLAYFSVTKKQRPPHKARFGSVIERLFGTTLSQIIHNLKGNTKIMKNPRQVSSSFNPINHATWTLTSLNKLLTSYFYDFYDTRDHSALCESPKDAFENGLKISGSRPIRLIPYDEEFLIMTLPAAKRNNGTAKVDPQRGVKVNYIYYYCDQFSRPGLEGTHVPVRFDPNNMGIVFCLIKDRWVKCFSEYYSIFVNKTEKQIMIASEELRKKKKNHSSESVIWAKALADFFLQAEAAEIEFSNQHQMDMLEAPQLRVLNGSKEALFEENFLELQDPDYYSKLDFSLDEND